MVFHSLFSSSESLAETFSLKNSTQSIVTDASSLISFSLNPTSSSTHTNKVMEGPSQTIQNSSSQASIPVSVTATVNSTQALPFMQLTGPQQASALAPNHISPQHYVAISPTFQHTESNIQTTPLQLPIPASSAAVQTTTMAGTNAVSVVAATTTDTLAAVAQPVPLVNHRVPESGASFSTTPATYTVTPTHNLLQPSLVMSDQNLQWILSTAAHSQQNPEQAVSNPHTFFFIVFWNFIARSTTKGYLFFMA